MGNRNYPKIDSRDMELFQRINKHGFVDMYYIYNFIKLIVNQELLQIELISLFIIDICLRRKHLYHQNIHQPI